MDTLLHTTTCLSLCVITLSVDGNLCLCLSLCVIALSVYGSTRLVGIELARIHERHAEPSQHRCGQRPRQTPPPGSTRRRLTPQGTKQARHRRRLQRRELLGDGAALAHSSTRDEQEIRRARTRLGSSIVVAITVTVAAAVALRVEGGLQEAVVAGA